MPEYKPPKSARKSQVITYEEASRRSKIYGPKHSLEKLIELRYSARQPRYVIDQTNFGNVSTFIGHSVSLSVLSLFKKCSIRTPPPPHSQHEVDDFAECKQIKKLGKF